MSGQDHLKANTVGEGLVLLRGRAGLPRDELARLAEVSSATLGRYESDATRKLDLTVLYRLLVELGSLLETDPDTLWLEFSTLMGDIARADLMVVRGSTGEIIFRRPTDVRPDRATSSRRPLKP